MNDQDSNQEDSSAARETREPSNSLVSRGLINDKVLIAFLICTTVICFAFFGIDLKANFSDVLTIEVTQPRSADGEQEESSVTKSIKISGSSFRVSHERFRVDDRKTEHLLAAGDDSSPLYCSLRGMWKSGAGNDPLCQIFINEDGKYALRAQSAVCLTACIVEKE